MNKRRLIVLLVAILGLFLIIFFKLIYLQVIKHQFFSNKSSAQISKKIKIQSHRGLIYDRHNSPLSMNVSRYSIYAVPPKVSKPKNTARALSQLLDIDVKHVSSQLKSNYPFIWVKRKLSLKEKEAVMALNLEGVYFLPEEKRVYPNGVLLSDVLGFMGTDGGLSGLEYYFNKHLSGSSGMIHMEGDPYGVRLLSGAKQVKGVPKGFKQAHRFFEPNSFDGSHLYLTIDQTLQHMTEYYLEKSILENEAKSGQVVVMAVPSGEILALADYPFYNPNRFYEYSDTRRKNSVVVDVFEPGSVLKVATYAAVLEEGIVTPGTVMMIPETLEIGPDVISEAHEREEGDTGERIAEDILVESLNVGTALFAQELGDIKLYKYLKAFGFGVRSDISLPGESAGLLRKPNDWAASDIATISFGQGVGVTSLQLAVMMGVICNDGVLVRPQIIRYLSDFEGVTLKKKKRKKPYRVISETSALKVREALVNVVEKGTATRVRIPGYKLGGKTGTAQVAGPGGVGYLEDEYVASFVGFLTQENPSHVIVVNIHSPKKRYYGSSVAGPVFKNIASFILKKEMTLPSSYYGVTDLK
tara:strand:- start:538 stop:2289 length:1752 start_codon:yes stop_codon:yes gene_type:complete